MTAEQGHSLGGRYSLTDRIAAGGMGDVWRAQDSVLGRTVAIKVLRTRIDERIDPTFTARFRDEARHTASLSHPNIAAVYDYGEDDGVAYLVMELVPGTPLSELIARGPMNPTRAQGIIGQCALALAAAHQAGVVHRDVKPANILVTPDGQVKLTDFGIARAVDGSGHTRTGEVMGTPQYLSPEQAQGKQVTGATDLYSLGVVAFELVTGRMPFDAGSPVATALAHITDPPPALPEQVGDPLRAAIESCLAKSPAQRPASAASLAALLGMPISGVAHASLATSVIPVTDSYAAAPPIAPASPMVPPPAPVAPTGELEQPAYRTAQPRRGGGWWWLLPVLAAFVVGGFLLTQSGLLGGRSTPTPTPSATKPGVTTRPTTPTSSTSPTSTSPSSSSSSSTSWATGSIAVADYINLQVDQARAKLKEAGFINVRSEQLASDRPAGTVLNITPVGPVAVNQQITLTVSDGSKRQTSSPPTSTNPTTGGATSG